jgi:hypothetical protein
MKKKRNKTIYRKSNLKIESWYNVAVIRCPKNQFTLSEKEAKKLGEALIEWALDSKRGEKYNPVMESIMKRIMIDASTGNDN